MRKNVRLHHNRWRGKKLDGRSRDKHCTGMKEEWEGDITARREKDGARRIDAGTQREDALRWTRLEQVERGGRGERKLLETNHTEKKA
jgi:hypothetical protein